MFCMVKKTISTDSLIEMYSDEEVREYLKCDKLEAKTVKRLNALLNKTEK